MTDKNELIGLVLAAGKGKRMKSDLPKVLHQVGARPMVLYCTDIMEQLALHRRIVVVGHKADLVRDVLPTGVDTVLQEEQLGTGHAVQCAAHKFNDSQGALVLLYGDVPLLRAETIRNLIDQHTDSGAAATILTTELDDPTGYGRVLRDAQGAVTALVEHKDATDEQLRIREINTGIGCFRIPLLLRALDMLSNDNAQGEYYVTDCVGILREQGHPVSAVIAPDSTEVLGVNNLDELAFCEKVLKQRSED